MRYIVERTAVNLTSFSYTSILHLAYYYMIAYTYIYFSRNIFVIFYIKLYYSLSLYVY